MNLVILYIFAATVFFNMPDKNASGDPESINQSRKLLFSFGILADVQYADYDYAGTRFYRSSVAKLRAALVSFAEDSTDFIINLGDMIDKDYVSYKPVLNLIDSSGLKFYHITGNHDYSVEPRFKNRIPVPSLTKYGYYSIIYENFRFIFLNGNEISTYVSGKKAIIKQANNYISELKNKGELNAVEWNGGIGGKQLRWLREQLDDATVNNEKVFLACHFPVYPNNVHNLLNYKEVLLILEKYRNIIAWFNGHNHSGNYGIFNMIHFVTFKGMVETETTTSYAIVEVYNNNILIRGFGMEKNQILSY